MSTPSEVLKQYILLVIWIVGAAQDHPDHGWYKFRNILLLDKSAEIKTVVMFFLFNLYLIFFFLQLNLWLTVLV